MFRKERVLPDLSQLLVWKIPKGVEFFTFKEHMYNVHLYIPVARTLFELLSVDLKHF